eukprot:COSAG03_NODE_2381_length_2824_cov_2.674128_2_plen_132_part_00
MAGGFTYVNGPSTYKATGTWGISGPGVTAEWSSGGESEWSSMGVPPMETKAECHRVFNVSRAGKYAVRSPKLTVGFSQSSCILIATVFLAGLGEVLRPPLADGAVPCDCDSGLWYAHHRGARGGPGDQPER